MMKGNGKSSRLTTSLIESFLDLTESLPTPLIFRQWAAIWMINAALERRVWMPTLMLPLYPNMFVSLIAPPAVGKSVSIDLAKALLRETDCFHIAPSSMTKASMVDELAEVTQDRVFGTDVVQFSSLIVCSSELGTLITGNNLEQFNTMNEIFDCPPEFKESRRSLKEEIRIPSPSLHLIAGTQPAYLATIMPPIAFKMGYASRVLFIFSDEGRQVQLFGPANTGVDGKLRQHIVRDLASLAKLYGPVKLTHDAMAKIQEFYEKSSEEGPKHILLRYYLNRRHIHLAKIAIATSVAESDSLVITSEHVDKALGFLHDAEARMPQIFREMQQSDDSTLMDECLEQMLVLYMRGGKKPLRETVIMQIIRQKFDANKCMWVVQTMVKSGMLSDVSTATDKFRVYKPIQPGESESVLL